MRPLSRKTILHAHALELAEHFVMWEYAIAMCGYLMRVCPFDQPDVASAKAEVLKILAEGQPEPDFVQDFIGDVHMGEEIVLDVKDDALYIQ